MSNISRSNVFGKFLFVVYLRIYQRQFGYEISSMVGPKKLHYLACLFFLGCSIARWLHISRYIPAFYITACLPSYPIAAACSQLMSLALHLLIMFMFCIVFAHFLIFTFMYHQSGQNLLNLLLPSFTKTKESDRSLHSCF